MTKENACRSNECAQIPDIDFDELAMGKMNCWEFLKCGRQVNGDKVAELGVCPASTTTGLHGINGGINGGRACWAIDGTKCNGKKQGCYAQKISNCLKCKFFEYVRLQEGDAFMNTKQIKKISSE